MVWKQGRLQNGNAPVFGSIEALVLFFFVWYVCVIVGHRMMVWQGSYQGRCIRHRSRGATMEGFVVEKISSASFCFVSMGSCGSEVFRSLS
jgi:hypothetical protein